jgi:putative membrane protein
MNKKTQPIHLTILITMLVALAGCLIISGIHPFDRTTWLLEIFPILIALPILFSTYNSFRLTLLLYVCIFIHMLILMLGGAYSYARVPLGFAIQDWLHLSRNPYDKIGHFFQGFAPALIAREILIRKDIIKGKKMLAFIVTCIVLAISASYELIEWASALMLGQGADEFLGTQGDMWDTQSDMFFALLGAISALTLFSRLQDSQIRKIISST